MKVYHALLVFLSAILLFAFSGTSFAVEAWITEVHNTSGHKMYMKTTNNNNNHKGVVKKNSRHCGNTVTKDYSNWEKGVYKVCKNDQLYMKKMGIPWYAGGGHYLTIWNGDKYGNKEPNNDKNKVRVFVGGCDGKDCLRIQVAGEDLPGKKPKIGKSGVAAQLEMTLNFNKSGFHFVSQNDNKATLDAIEAIAKYIDANKEFILKALKTE